MSYPFQPFPGPDPALPRPRHAGVLAALLGAALAAAPVSAGGTVYGHAEVTVGFPNGHITVGKTWETGEPAYEEVAVADDGYEVEERVIVRDCPPQKVVVVRQEPARCEKVVIVERPRHDRVVVVHPPRRDVVVIGGHPRHHVKPHRHHAHCGHHGWQRGGGHHGKPRGHIGKPRGHHGKPGGHIAKPGGHGGHGGGIIIGDGKGQNRGRNLFPSESQRPSRERGVQKKVVIAGR